MYNLFFENVLRKYVIQPLVGEWALKSDFHGVRGIAVVVVDVE
jgi:hypothetical protein